MHLASRSIMDHRASCMIIQYHSSATTMGPPKMSWGVVWKQRQTRNSHITEYLAKKPKKTNKSALPLPFRSLPFHCKIDTALLNMSPVVGMIGEVLFFLCRMGSI